MRLKIYPVPKIFKIRKQTFDLSGRLYIRLTDSYSDYLTDAICRFATAAKQDLKITYGRPENAETLLTLRLVDPKQGPEAYQITSNEAGLLLTGGTEEALFRGLASLSQLLKQLGNALPSLTIEDAPDITQRGVMLDVSRCKVPTLDTLKQMIDEFAGLKYNQLQIYTEHTFAFSHHPLVWADASPYTAQDMLEIKSYCNARFIQLVPNLNCFGHFERWLRHPEYHKYAECPDGFEHPLTGTHVSYGSTLKPNQQSLKLLDELHGEYLPLFDSEYFNIGGDEPWELGKGWSESLCQTDGTTKTYIDFIAKIKQLTDKRGRKMMFWSDIVLKQPDAIKTLPKGLIAMNWGYEATHPFKKECRQMAELKLPFYVCPGTSSWNSLTGRTSNMVANLASAARNAIAYNADGFLMTDWGDHGHHQYLPISYPGFALGACESWNHKASAKIDLVDLVDLIYFNEPDQATAKLIVEMGQILDLAPTELRNASLFNRLLFWQMRQMPGAVKDIPQAQLNACRDAFEALQPRLDDISSADRTRLKAELGTAIAMAIHSLDRLRYFRERPKSVRRGAAVTKTMLRTQLLQIMGQHDTNWLARNRPGGLAESRGHLEKSLAAIG